MSTFHPLILAINAKAIDNEQKLELFKLVESYIVRREICGLTTKNYNKVVTGFIASLAGDGGDSGAALRSHIAGLTGDASKMPKDVQVSESFAQRDVYNGVPTPRLRYILEHLEYGHRTKFDEVTVSTANLTVEHIMPRKWANHWRLPGDIVVPVESSFEAATGNHQIASETRVLMDARQRRINTMGNLTLLTESLNPHLSNAGWPVKRVKIGESLLAINRDVAKMENWTESEIEKRASDLARIANKRWPDISIPPGKAA